MYWIYFIFQSTWGAPTQLKILMCKNEQDWAGTMLWKMKAPELEPEPCSGKGNAPDSGVWSRSSFHVYDGSAALVFINLLAHAKVLLVWFNWSQKDLSSQIIVHLCILWQKILERCFTETLFLLFRKLRTGKSVCKVYRLLKTFFVGIIISFVNLHLLKFFLMFSSLATALVGRLVQPSKTTREYWNWLLGKARVLVYKFIKKTAWHWGVLIKSDGKIKIVQEHNSNHLKFADMSRKWCVSFWNIFTLVSIAFLIALELDIEKGKANLFTPSSNQEKTDL